MVMLLICKVWWLRWRWWPVDEVDPIGKEEANIEGREDTEKEKVKSGHLHFVLSKGEYIFQNSTKIAVKIYSQKNPTFVRSFAKKGVSGNGKIVWKGRKKYSG